MIIFFGLLSGIIAGMGMGGGTILIPLLVLFCSINQHLAQAINLAVFVPMCIVCILIHLKNKLIDFKSALIVGIPASIAGVVGSWIALTQQPQRLRLYFGIFLLALGVYQLVVAIATIITNKANKSTNNALQKNPSYDKMQNKTK